MGAVSNQKSQGIERGSISSGTRRRPQRPAEIAKVETRPALSVRALIFARRLLREVVRASPLIAIAVLLVRNTWAAHTPLLWTLLASLAGASLWFRWRQKEHPEVRTLSLSLTSVLVALAVVQGSGGFSGASYPLILVVLAGVAAYASPLATIVSASVALLFEFSIRLSHDDWNLKSVIWHASFALTFSLFNYVMTRAEVLRVRNASEREKRDEKARMKDDTRLFRLATVPRATSAGDAERLFQSSVDEVHHSLFHALQLLHRTMGLHSAVLLMLHDERLVIAEMVSDSDNIARGPFTSGEGAIGAAIKRRATTNLRNLRAGYKGLAYYRDGSPVRSFLAIPLLENDEVVGVLCLDRISDDSFSDRDESVAEDAGAHLLRVMRNERIFVQLERSKREQTILYEASKSLGNALDRDAVVEAAMQAAKKIVPYEFMALTRFDPYSKKHSVVQAIGDGAEDFLGLSFRENSSLVSMAVRNKHYLPYRGEFDSRQQALFTKRSNLRNAESVLVLPLIVREEAIGTMVLASKERGIFQHSSRSTLQMLTNQVAAAISNADAVQRLEEMATTDGLTGCLNKRAFLEELDRKMRAAERFGRKLSLIVTDIDHFKSVNDTYGHATGDVVIRELGALLRSLKRETDIVARFGGEEFCVLCEQTDTDGALNLAERIREQLGQKVFQTEHGELVVTASLGVATYPQHAKAGGELFEASDQALYAAKHGGRNQVCAAKG